MSEKNSDSDQAFKKMMAELDAVLEQSKGILDDTVAQLTRPSGLMTVREALETDDPLSNIRAELWGYTEEQRIFELVHSAILEVNSGGVSMLWDHLRFDEIDRLAGYLEEMGAQKTCLAIKEIRGLIVTALGDPPGDDAVFDFVGSDEFEKSARPFDLQFEAMVEEMESKLLEFARANVESLEQSPLS